MTVIESIQLKAAGAKWWHSQDYASPSLSKASLGEFFYTVLREGAQIGSIWSFNPAFDRSAVYVTVFMTDDMKTAIEAKTRFRFVPPPKISLNSGGGD